MHENGRREMAALIRLKKKKIRYEKRSWLSRFYRVVKLSASSTDLSSRQRNIRGMRLARGEKFYLFFGGQ